jgi:copper oxidase (laccase) domain-containing protein
MEHEFGSRPDSLVVGIGPSIGPCCYEVGDEVIEAWESAGVPGWEAARVEKEPRAHFDLWTANRQTLHRAGVPEGQIEVAGLCTRCNGERFFSHRAAMAGERPRGRMIMVAQLN